MTGSDRDEPCGYVAVLHRLAAAADLPVDLDTSVVTQAESFLAEQASQLDPRQLASLAATLRARLDQDGMLRAERDAVEDRELFIAQDQRGRIVPGPAGCRGRASSITTNGTSRSPTASPNFSRRAGSPRFDSRGAAPERPSSNPPPERQEADRSGAQLWRSMTARSIRCFASRQQSMQLG